MPPPRKAHLFRPNLSSGCGGLSNHLPSTLVLFKQNALCKISRPAAGQASWCPRCPWGEQGRWWKCWGLKREGAVVSWGCRDAAPHTGQLETTGSSSLTVLEAGGPNSRCQQGTCPESCRGSPSVPVPASGGGRQSLTCGCISQSHGHLPPVCLSVLFLERYQVRAHPTPV